MSVCALGSSTAARLSAATRRNNNTSSGSGSRGVVLFARGRRACVTHAMKKVFIDGEAGTTGLQVRDRLAAREDIEIISLTGDDRKDPAKRAEFLNAADAAILCLPDQAAIEGGVEGSLGTRYNTNLSFVPIFSSLINFSPLMPFGTGTRRGSHRSAKP